MHTAWVSTRARECVDERWCVVVLVVVRVCGGEEATATSLQDASLLRTLACRVENELSLAVNLDGSDKVPR